MVPQTALSIVATIKPGHRDALGRLLQYIGNNPGDNAVIPFGQLPGTHYARLFIVDEGVSSDGHVFPPLLVLMSDFDGSEYYYLNLLVDLAGNGLDQLYSHCEDYTKAGVPPSRQSRLAYLRTHKVQADTMYVNAIGRTVDQIRQEAQLRDAIEDFLSRSEARWTGSSPTDVRKAIQDFVKSEPTLQWAQHPVTPLSLWYRLQDAIDLVTLPLVALLLLPLLVVILPIWLVLLRYHEITEPDPHVKPDPAHIQELAALEDQGPQNQFSAVGVIKPGWFRHLTVMAIFRIAYYGTRHIFNYESLGGVKTIHFARWVSINKLQRAIFVSNYDGSLESYMDDFIDKLSWGLNAVFSNGVGYPQTTFLLWGGAKKELQFKDYLRVHQIPTQVWYAAYDQLTALNINNNAEIRAGLFGPMTASETERWVRRL